MTLLDRLEAISDTFGGNSVALLAVSFVLAASMMVLNDRLIVNTRQKTDAVALLDQLITETWQTRAQLGIAESAQRGYLLTRAPEYFQPYDQATQQVNLHLQAIDRLLLQANLATHPNIQTTMNQLVTSVSKKAAEMSVSMDFAKKRQFERALAVVKLDIDNQETRNIATLSQQFEQEVQAYREDLADNRNQWRRVTRWFVMVGPLIFVGLVVLVIRRLLKELAEKAELHARLTNENVEYEQNIRGLTTKLHGQALQAQTNIERERYQLSRELHDELGSLLTAIKMDISWVIKHLKDLAPQATEKLKKTNQYVDRGINFKREIVQNLHPSMIKSFGLIASLQNLMDEGRVRNQWQMDIIMPEHELVMNETVSLIVYRLVQESLNNCSKYAHAKHVSVHLMHDEKTLKLEVVDDGIGCDIALLNASSNGVQGMRNRVESIGGHFEIHSAPNQGMSVRVLLPYLSDTPDASL